MLKNFRNFSLFVFILFASDLISQTINLEQLEQLEQLGDTFAADEVIEADDPDVKPLTQRVRVLKESDVEFGYQGSNDSFIVEPKPKKNPKSVSTLPIPEYLTVLDIPLLIINIRNITTTNIPIPKTTSSIY